MPRRFWPCRAASCCGEPGVGGQLHELQRFGVVEHGGQVEGDPGPRVQSAGTRGGAVEHAAQGLFEEADEGETQRSERRVQFGLGEQAEVWVGAQLGGQDAEQGGELDEGRWAGRLGGVRRGG